MKKKKYFNNGKLTIAGRNIFWGYLFILPWIIGFLVFTVFPFVFSIYLSLNNINFNIDGIQTKFVGLQYYKYAFQVDTEFPLNFTSSIINIVLSVPLVVIFSLIISIILNKNFKARGIFRAIFFLPVIIISGPVVSELMSNNASKIVDPSRYFIYKFIATLPKSINTPFLYIFDNLVLILWFSGVQILFFLAGLQKISNDIYEAASIDGANSWVTFWKITLPIIKPFILVNAVYTIVDLASFPNNVINTSITNHMFDIDKVYSYSASLSWIYFIAVLAIIGVTFFLLREREPRRILNR